MITLTDICNVITAIIPLYVAVIAAYISLKWWKLFTPDQCTGINKFVSNFSIPLLSFHYIAKNNPYKMNLKLVSVDCLQKLLAFIILTIVAKIRSSGNMSWIITGISLSTLPNTLIIGIPLLKAMYGDEAENLLNQIVMLQSLIWYNLLLILFEIHLANENIHRPPHLDVTEAQHSPEPKDGNNDDERIQYQKKRTTMKYVLLTAGRKLIRNPNTSASFLGIVWASIHFRFAITLPKVIDDSVSILADGGLGMAMFSLGLFMASRESVVACGTRKAVLAMVMKFIAGPCLMAVPSITLGLRGTLLKVAIVQAALPVGMVPFVFATEYSIHPDILSTGVVLGLLVTLPFTLAYYFLLAL